MNLHMSPEESLLLRRRARHRLIGAIALLALAVLVLPLLLDSEPRSTHDAHEPQPESNALGVATQLNAEAPQANALAQQNTLASQPINPAPEPTALAPQEKNLSISIKPSTAMTAPAAKISVAASMQSPAPPAVGKTDTAASVPAQAPQALGSTKLKPPQVKPLSADSARTEDAVVKDKKSPHQPSDILHAQFAVQLGVFSNASNVRQLRKRLQGLGIATYVETLPSGAIRVRSGPYGSRAEADQVLANIRLADMSAQIVNLGH